jgi:hypothetical protein
MLFLSGEEAKWLFLVLSDKTKIQKDGTGYAY